MHINLSSSLPLLPLLLPPSSPSPPPSLPLSSTSLSPLPPYLPFSLPFSLLLLPLFGLLQTLSLMLLPQDTSKFKFPLKLDMSPYCEGLSGEDAIYELFSVVIHSGSTHSGHYIAYIRDIDAIGTWTHPVCTIFN